MLTLDDNGQWARFFDRIDAGRPRDLCQFARWAVGYPLLFVFLGSIAGLFAIAVVCAIVAVFSSLYWADPSLFIQIAISGFVLLGIVVLGGTTMLALEAIERGSVPSLPPTVRAAYNGWKDKYCPLIEWK